MTLEHAAPVLVLLAKAAVCAGAIVGAATGVAAFNLGHATVRAFRLSHPKES